MQSQVSDYTSILPENSWNVVADKISKVSKKSAEDLEIQISAYDIRELQPSGLWKLFLEGNSTVTGGMCSHAPGTEKRCEPFEQ